MPYCVKCGVELASSEKVCPLCLTPVVVPGGPPQAGEKPYPSRLEAVNPRIDRRYGAKLAMLLLMIPLLMALLCDVAITLRVTWSAYVLGAGACVCCWVILPFYLGIKKPYLYIAVDFLAAAGYLALIAWRAGGLTAWYTPIALPLTLLAGLVSVACVYAARRRRQPVLVRAANIVLIAAAMLIGIEICTDLYLTGSVRLQWSVYALAPLIVFAAIFHVVERNTRLKALIRRKLFF